MMRRLRIAGIVTAIVLAVVVVLVVAVVVVVRSRYSEGKRLEDRTAQALILPSATEIVADLDYPPGNIAVSSSGRIFFTFHPDGNPPVPLNELRGVEPIPYPPETPEGKPRPTWHTPLALRVDSKDRLWVLDYGHFGIFRPRLLAFDLDTNELIDHYDFPSEVAGLFSMLNDFQVDPDGKKIYLADTSPIRQTPAIVIYDTEARSSRRVLEGDRSVQAQDYVIQAPMRDMFLLGIVPLRLGVDSIALDRRGEWLYYGPVTGDRLYRVATKDLNDQSLSAADLSERVEDYGPKTISDGLSTDLDDNIYITDPEHSAIMRLSPDRKLTTMVKDSPFRWPDGLSFGPDGWLYVTCSALHQVLFERAAEIRRHAPFQIIRFRPGPMGVPGQ